MKIKKHYDVIVIGGGHAGVEAAAASARTGAETLLVTHNKETLGAMSCNPSIGGIGKSHLVKEIDALGGLMAHAADRAGIQFRILNAKKGPAVQATRAQIDRVLYKQTIREMLEQQKNLTIFQDAVDDLIVEDERVRGVVTKIGLTFQSKSVVLTAGTFLNGKVHIGLVNYQAGRMGDPASIRLAERLRELPLRVGRLKTGTPARLDANTIDYSKLVIQPGDFPTPVFSFLGHVSEHPEQIVCHIARTNEKTHDIIRAGLDRSPLFRGDIKGIGPRYCPSIEDKVVRFSDKSSHQIFVEPEGLHTTEIYPNGISTSLPFDVQYDFIHSIEGFEQAEITRAGYAIEYDFFDPRDLKRSLETRSIRGLFFAGQINGTTGYEEAAAQGLLAGLNASHFAKDKDPWTPRRDEAYLGVLVDDLITKGTNEPYRMFTSRAEYRLLLREDNADLRLTKIGYELGLVNEVRWQAFQKKCKHMDQERQRFQNTILRIPSKEAKAINPWLENPLQKEYRLAELLKRPELTYEKIAEVYQWEDRDLNAGKQIEIETKYAGYIDRQQAEINRHLKYENLRIPENFQYDDLPGLSSEIQQKLKKAKPETVGIASRIPGVTPAAISILLVHLKP